MTNYAHMIPRGRGEHYARTSDGELIGPYDSAAELERELAAAELSVTPELDDERVADMAEDILRERGDLQWDRDRSLLFRLARERLKT